MKKLFSKEVIIGLCVILAMAILYLGIEFLKGVNVFKASNYYYATYTSVEGLAVSAPVTVNGFKVGQVREIEYEFDNPGHVRVEIALDDRLKVPQGSKAVLATDLLGTASIQLQLAQTQAYHKVGDALEGTTASGLMETVSTDLMPSVSQIFPQIDSLLTTTNRLMADPALAASMQRLDAITANLEVTTRQLARVTATLHPITADVKNITGNVSTITSDVAQVSGQLRELPVDSLVADIQTTIANLRALSEEINNPNSTMGKLMNDPALYNNLNTTISSLDSLFVDIKKNPKRYISIKLL